MSESETLFELFKETDQHNMIAKLRDPDCELEHNTVRAVGPNADYPLPWVISKFPGTTICSIVSVGGRINETVISMIKTEDAEKVLEEINFT